MTTSMERVVVRLSGAAVPMLILAAVGGCGAPGDADGPSHTADVSVRDSAGVRIVEILTAPGEVEAFAELSGEPTLELGTVEGSEASAFERISDVRTLPDGSVLVAEGGADELRLFTAGGVHVRTFGRKGEGPGEFGHLQSIVGDPGDTVRVWDNVRQRLTVFTIRGELAATVSFGGTDPYGRIHRMQPLADGSLVVRSRWSALREDETLTSSDFRIVRDTVVLRRLDPTGALLDSIAVLPSDEQIESVELGNRGGRRTLSTRRASRPLGRASEYAVVGDRVVGGANDRFELTVWRPDGSVETVVRWPGLARPVTEAQFDSLRGRSLDRMPTPAARRSTAKLYDDFPHPETWPAFSEIRADGEDRVWVREYTASGDGERWYVVALDGTLLGRVDAPADLRVTEIGPDHVLGWSRDELDVPYVRRYDLRRISSPGAPPRRGSR